MQKRCVSVVRKCEEWTGADRHLTGYESQSISMWRKDLRPWLSDSSPVGPRTDEHRYPKASCSSCDANTFSKRKRRDANGANWRPLCAHSHINYFMQIEITRREDTKHQNIYAFVCYIVVFRTVFVHKFHFLYAWPSIPGLISCGCACSPQSNLWILQTELTRKIRWWEKVF